MTDKNTENWHVLSISDTLKQLNVDSERGLAASEVEHRHQEYGLNVLTTGKGESPLQLFINQFKDPMIYILIVAFLLMLYLGEYIEAGVIFIIVLANAIIGFMRKLRR